MEHLQAPSSDLLANQCQIDDVVMQFNSPEFANKYRADCQTYQREQQEQPRA